MIFQMENLNLFGNLIKEDTQWLQEHGINVTISKGETLIADNRAQSNIYFVISGIFKVLADAKSSMPIAILGPGEIIGESSLVERERSSATVIAVDKSVVMKVNRDVIMKYIEEHPAFGLRLYKGLYKITVERLRNTNRQLSDSYV